MMRFLLTIAAIACIATNDLTANEPLEIVVRYCGDCHGPDYQEAELDAVSAVRGALPSHVEFASLELMKSAIAIQRMPPSESETLPPDQRARLLAWMDERMRAIAESQADDPGPVVIARLTKAEYANAVRDLTGLRLDAGRQLPEDGGAGEGFANVGEAQSLTLEHLEKYLQASREIQSHLRVSPASGMQWSSSPLRSVAKPQEARQEVLDRITHWYGNQEVHLVEGRDRALRDHYGLSHGLYLEAAYRWQKLGRDPEALPRLANDYAVPLIPASIAKWHFTFASDTADLPEELQAVAKEWRSWPADLSDEELRSRAKKLDKSCDQLASAKKGGAKQFFRDRNRRVVDGNDLHKKTHFNAERIALSDFTRVDVRYLNGPWPDQPEPEDKPDRPYFLTAAMVREAAPPEDRAELETLLDELVAIAQPAAQDVASFRRTHGHADSVEGVLPTSDELKLWDEATRQAFEPIRTAAEAENAKLAQIARQQMAAFARRAWRRPLVDRELDRLVALFTDARQTGASYDAAFKAALHAVFVSPAFLYRTVLMPEDFAKQAEEGSETRPLDSYELASRLSFFLWASIPDDELLALAETDQLRELEVLLAQTRRMIRDERVRGMAREFGGQWLGFAGFKDFTGPDTERFPEFTPSLAEAMEQEGIAFFEDLVRNDRPVTALVTANWTFANAELANHYGLPGITGTDMQRVMTDGTPRGGVLGMGAVLARSSEPLRTSPVHRGVWVLEQILGEHLPPPPANVQPLSDDEVNPAGESIVEQLAKHRAQAHCAVCHDRIDPLGLTLENFDPVGRWRESDRFGEPIEAHAALKSGQTLTGTADLRDHLAQQDDVIVRQFCRKMLGYALGRGLQPGDSLLIQSMQKRLKEEDQRVSLAVEMIVMSPQFRERRRTHAER